jgi:hypothetical protein
MKKLLLLLIAMGISCLLAGCSADSLTQLIDARRDNLLAQAEKTRAETALMEQERQLELRQRQAEVILKEQEAKRKEEQLRIDAMLYEQQRRERMEMERFAFYTALLILFVGSICAGACIYNYFHTESALRLYKAKVKEDDRQVWHRIAQALRCPNEMPAGHMPKSGDNGEGMGATKLTETEVVWATDSRQ